MGFVFFSGIYVISPDVGYGLLFEIHATFISAHTPQPSA